MPAMWRRNWWLGRTAATAAAVVRTSEMVSHRKAASFGVAIQPSSAGSQVATDGNRMITTRSTRLSAT
jgi:hypothetical protein